VCQRAMRELRIVGDAVKQSLAVNRSERRLRKSLVQVRANERTAAFVALYTLMAGKPLISAIDPVRMIDPPSFIKGRPFCAE